MTAPVTYVRFVVSGLNENPYWSTGVITKARELRDADALEPYEVERLNEVFDWFNTHLPCPPFKEKRGAAEWTEDAVAWFKDEAREPIGHMWEIVAILRQHRVPVRLFQSTNPGQIGHSYGIQIVSGTPS